MSYFLKKTNLKKGLYLQIYESYYDADKGYGAHRAYEVLGYEKDLICKGIGNPIEYYQEVVKQLNDKKKIDKVNKNETLIRKVPFQYFGHFAMKQVMNSLNIEGIVNLLSKSITNFQFDLFNILEGLVYARVILPCSKRATQERVLPFLYGNYDSFSYDQILEGVGFLGSEYEKFVELFTVATRDVYGLDFSHTYFDCTNFYFEIDREDDFRKKGPSKENRHAPIVGLGLLLDANQIPIGMNLFPGNQSEKPIIRKVISSLKEQNDITGRTIQIADKGLNCAENIYEAIKNNDGYLFSKSVKKLSAAEQAWVFNENEKWIEVTEETTNRETGLISLVEKYKYKECVDYFSYSFTDDKDVKHEFKVQEKRILTYNKKLAEKKKYEISKMAEKAKTLCTSQAKRDLYGDSSKYVLFTPTDKKGTKTNGKVRSELNIKAIEQDYKYAGYNLMVTSEVYLSATDIYKAYHNLWRIEESFRIMKSDLDARPVFLQREDTIKGHFLICYISVLLLRLLQFKVFKGKYSSNEIVYLMKSLKFTKITDYNFINSTARNNLILDFAQDCNLPISKLYLKQADLNRIMEKKILK